MSQGGHTHERLNRDEYVAEVKTLVGVDVNAKDVLPQDIQLDGFDNVAAALTVSPSFLDQYIASARRIAKLAVGSPNPRVSNVKYSIAANQSPDLPLPLGTRGGVRFKHNFPADGEYRINITDLNVGLYTNQMENQSTLVIMIDGKIVARKSIGMPSTTWIDGVVRKGADGRAQIMRNASRRSPYKWRPASVMSLIAFIERSQVESDENCSAAGSAQTASAMASMRMGELRSWGRATPRAFPEQRAER